MTIRTEQEYDEAQRRLDSQMLIVRSRSLTDGEKQDFEALVRDIETYQNRHPNIGRRPSEPSGSSPGTASDSVSLSIESMRRVLAQAGLEPVAHSAPSSTSSTGNVALSIASMEREIRRAGMRRTA
ncbi:hypothetical protein [Methylobacterium sp. Leaf118]|uniref:hypothetical protein n=1 Tax=Methylobacterium sp. Leaf118 TaxID=2876562 RepID=UPI001E2DA490|nr:hypothetical protein [Methylobacterium sp. Leaf118]